jgi:biopolymer transport protein ExbB
MKHKELRPLIVIITVLMMVLCALPMCAQTERDSMPKMATDSSEISKPPSTGLPNEGASTNLFATVKQGGPLMLFLVLLGLTALTVIIERVIFYTRSRIWSKDTVERYLSDVSASSHARYLEEKEDELRGSLQAYISRMEKGLALLSGIGNLAPIVGFLGTVIGMISAFAAIAAATTVNAKVVAVGIQMALVTTAGGLIVAAPSLAFFYLFMHIIQNLSSRSEEIISDMCKSLPRISHTLNGGETNKGEVNEEESYIRNDSQARERKNHNGVQAF